MHFPDPQKISPEDFELLVKDWFESCQGNLDSFQAQHRKKLRGYDGEYEIDVSISFKLFEGADINVIIECKRYNNPISRDLVQVLKDKKESVGAHKAFLVGTSKFQSGAIEYAAKNGIALIQVVDGRVMYIQASAKPIQKIPENAEPLAGFFWGNNPSGKLIFPLGLSRINNYSMMSYLQQ